MTKEQIGNALRDERVRQGVTIRALAKRCEISTTTLQSVEKGWYNGRIDIYLTIADALGAKLSLDK